MAGLGGLVSLKLALRQKELEDESSVGSLRSASVLPNDVAIRKILTQKKFLSQDPKL